MNRNANFLLISITIINVVNNECLRVRPCMNMNRFIDVWIGSPTHHPSTALNSILTAIRDKLVTRLATWEKFTVRFVSSSDKKCEKLKRRSKRKNILISSILSMSFVDFCPATESTSSCLVLYKSTRKPRGRSNRVL